MKITIKKSIHLFKHYYIASSILLSILIFFYLFLLEKLDLGISMLMSFNICAAVFIVLSTIFMFKAETHHIKEKAKILDEGKWIDFCISILVFCVIMCGFYFEIYGAKNKSFQPIGLGIFSILLAWGFICFIFAQHYAHNFYMKDDRNSSLNFPGTHTPDYWDFLYFSVVINMCFQTSDINITSSSMRKLVMFQSLIAFFLNIIIISTSINLIAGMINN